MGIFDWFKRKKNGIHKWHYQNGQLSQEISYKDDKFDGAFKTYYENGQLKSETNFENDKFVGVSKEYYENGKLKKESIQDYKEDGGVYNKQYYENGQLRKESNWKDGNEDGLIKEYFESGVLEIQGNMKDGEKNGLFKIYYQNEQLKEESNWKNGKKNGLVKEYFESGALKEESNWGCGMKWGLVKYYYENGQLALEGNMNKGKQSGIWKKYNEDGEVEEINYDSVSENEQIELPLYLTKYAGFEGIQLYLNERVNFASIFDRFNMGLHKGEKIEDMIKIISNNYNNEQKTNIKKGFFDVFQLLGTLSKEEEKTLIKIKQPQIKEEFEKRFGSSKPIPDGLDVVLIALHPNVKDTLQELIEKL